MSSLTSSYILGSRIIEKHFTHNKRLNGNDHYHAMDIHDLKNFNLKLNEVIELLGTNEEKTPIDSEITAIKNARRSIVLKNKVSKNDIIKESYLTYKRPGLGISPTEWNNVVGKTVNKNLEEDHILQWEDFNN